MVGNVGLSHARTWRALTRALVVAAIAMVTLTAATSARAACPQLKFIGVRGSGEHSGFGHTIGSVLSHINAAQSGVGNQTVDYWAVDVNAWEPKYFANYVTSVTQGVRNLNSDVNGFRAACPDKPIALAGYSQGAEVIDHWINDGANRKNIVGVALLGDPRFDAQNGAPLDQGNYNHRLNGVSYAYFPHVAGFGGDEHYPAGADGWVRSYCMNHDPICNTSSPAALIGCGIGTNCAHYHYAEADWNGATYTQDAANFLLARFRQTLPRSGPSTGPPNNSPSQSPPAPTSPASPGSSNPGSPSSTVPVPRPTFAETAGGVAHTWTNPADAGGSEGPSIASGQTVQIQCWVTGFRVADGNTYWYEVASSPWNDSYYVSADAFYNNGQISGSLVGTPFVDPAVPSCTGSGSTSGGGKTYFAETTGGVAHTWTNYTDAGGTQGPSIGSNQTVQIACWVTGFRVADGNTYWYQIGSSPWDLNYYVSADAFYNNGETSGSLLGTPFVDPKVPEC